ncbi:MAG: iron chelate uptake ABC transporter family permease subunit [Caldilineaceae bacterium SB0668_bin_21]|nr:iron chelate uptake ABC transporter family permease subunit [Caldilineaceae bacterium SB0668_bin_21]MYC21528.1 iron chelate uptake ABC transporter family permease subunit [Caldilineaceae bacterium SB0662_bin_25]
MAMSTHGGSRPATGRIRDTVLLGLALVSLTVVSAWSLFIGVSDIGLSDLLRAESSKMLLFVESRVPRLAAILLSGSAMGVVGLIMQSLVRNRFVAPTTAGTVDAASLGLVIATVWFASASVFLKMTIAVIFALAGTALFMALVQRLRYAADIIVVPLIGIMLGGVIQAAATFIALRYDLLQSLSAWTNGDFSGILRGRYELLYLVGAMTVVAYLFANRFTLAGMGRDVAVNLGVNYHRVLYGGMALAASVSAVAVVVVGGIPFLGLVVPNLVTMTMGDNLRRVLPLTAVSGAFFVLVCDIVSRTIRFPYEIPVGTVVGVVGGAIFLVLVLRSRFNAG